MGRRILMSVSTLIIITFILIYVYVVFKRRYEAVKPLKPEQIHLSYGERSNDIVLTWSTKKDPNCTYVVYGLCKGPLTRKTSGTRTKFTNKRFLESTQIIHRAVLKNLKYNTTYKYLVGSPKAWSELHIFKTPPEGENWAVKAIIFGGLGLKNAATLPHMIKDADKIDYSLIIHAGDIGSGLGEDHGAAGDDFMNAIQPLAAKVPYMVCPGNLERCSNYSHYRERFTMPGHDRYQNMFYSFNLGPVHFVSINTEAYYYGLQCPNNTNSVINQIRTQYNWLKRDLAEANKTANRVVRPWIILYGHRPMLCSNCLDFRLCKKKGYDFPHRVGNSSYGGYGLEELLKDYGVDLSIWHQQSYERLWPVYNKTVYNGSREAPYTNPRAPVHVATGAASDGELSSCFVNNPPAWSAFRSRDYGYSRLSVRNETHLFFEQLALKKNYTYMEQVDSFWLVREKHMPYVF